MTLVMKEIHRLVEVHAQMKVEAERTSFVFVKINNVTC